MTRIAVAGALLMGTILSGPAVAQVATTMAQPISGTRLDLTATGEVSRVPDVAVISAGVVTQAVTASDALAQNAARMNRARLALKRAGVADRDLQTASINLSPQYKYVDNQPPQLIGYQASNQLSVNFRDIARSGRILDALVAEGANQISGPNLTIDKPEAALDEARTKAIAAGRARAELYARALGMHLVRVIAVSEAGGFSPPPPMPIMVRAMAAPQEKTAVDPGEQKLQVSVNMTVELQ